jgi:hypothetical protein
MAREQRVVEHVRVGEYEAGVLARPAAVVDRRVAVVHRRAQTGHAEVAPRAASWSAASAFVGAR